MSASVRQGLLRMWLFVVAAVVGASLTPTQAHADPPGRLFYEIVVIVPGTRSQAWEATLYDAAGKPIQAPPTGQTVKTPIGEFVNVPGDQWHPGGMVRADMAKWMKTHDANVIMDMKPWAYRLYVDGEGSDTEVWTSTLLHDNTEIPPATNPIDTPMGPFRTAGPEATGWARAGWLPVSWLPDQPASLQLAGTAWRFAEILGAPTPDTVDATLELSADGTAAGRTGCNDFNGRYAVDGNHLAFTGLGYTKMACAAEPMATERAVQTVLNRTSGATSTADELRLVAEDGTLLARLVPMTP